MGPVLIVDDSPSISNEVATFLQRHGIDCTKAATGLEGLQCLRENPYIKLAIVDFNMPEMDGLTMIEEIKKESPDLKTAFIMLTTEFDRAKRDKGKALGLKGWIVKPFNGERAIATIKKLIEDE
ncbi:MAG: response regulator [Pseudomonadota bacterium]